MYENLGHVLDIYCCLQAEEDLVQVAEDAPNLKISPKVFKTLNVFVTACYRWPPWIDHLYPLNLLDLFVLLEFWDSQTGSALTIYLVCS